MKSAHRFGWSFALAAATACGGAVDRTAGPPASTGAPEADGSGAEASAVARGTAPGEDASTGIGSGARDGGAASGRGGDAGAFGWDGSVEALLEACPSGRDAFYVAVNSGPDFGSLPFGPFRATNLDHTWAATAQALSFSAEIEANSTLGGASVGVTTTQVIPLVPGTYPEPLNHSVPRPYLDLSVGDIALTADGYTGGSFVIADLAADGDAGVLSSVLMAFDLTVPGPQGTSEFVGCLRYAADAPTDGGSPSVLGDASGPALLAPCSTAPALYLEGSGYPGLDGTLLLTGDNASFGADNAFSTLAIDVASDNAAWQVSAITGTANGPFAGQFMSGVGGARVQISPPSGGCVEGPTGPFAVSQLATSSTTYDSVTAAAIWFDLQCASQGGTLRGCVAYGQ
jgi:hypothetical protein